MRAQFPFGQVEVTVQPGGLICPGEAFRPGYGDREDSIVMANAAVFVRVP